MDAIHGTVAALQTSIEEHGHANPSHAKSARALGAPQDQSACVPSLRGAHPGTAQPRLDALEKELSGELATEASDRVADVHLHPNHHPDAVQQRLDALEANLDDGLTQGACARDTVQRRLDALEAKLVDSLMEATSTRDIAVYELQMRYDELVAKLDGPVQDSVSALRSHVAMLTPAQNPSVAGRATLEMRLAYVEGTLQDFAEKHGQADAIHANLTSALVQQRLDALAAKLDDELMKAARIRQAAVCDLVELHVALAAEAGAREALRASLVDRHLSLELQLNVRINSLECALPDSVWEAFMASEGT